MVCEQIYHLQYLEHFVSGPLCCYKTLLHIYPGTEALWPSWLQYN